MNKNSQSQQISSRLRLVRDKLDQDEFGKLIGITRRQVSTMERSEVAVSIDVCITIYQRFGVSLTWLLLGEGPIYTKDEHELLNLVRRVPDVLSLIKKAIAGQEAICELAVMSQESGTSIRSQHKSAQHY